jgi:hypothetical protein
MTKAARIIIPPKIKEAPGFIKKMKTMGVYAEQSNMH